MTSSSEPAPTLVDAVRAVAADPDEAVAFGRVVEMALSKIAVADFGGISELGATTVRTHAASDPQVEALDRAQYAIKEGPCLTAVVADMPVVVCDDLATDGRWPRFGNIAAGLGVNSVVSFKLFDGRHTIGALNLYARAPRAFTSDVEEVGALLAAHAAVVMTASRVQANLKVALESRDIIGQAKGILMERYKLDDRQAFDALITVSQYTQRKLRDVADQLRTTGELPGLST